MYQPCTYLVSVGPSKCNPACVFHILTHQRVATGILQSLLDVRRLVTDHINHQLSPPKLAQLLIGRFHLQDKARAVKGDACSLTVPKTVWSLVTVVKRALYL